MYILKRFTRYGYGSDETMEVILNGLTSLSDRIKRIDSETDKGVIIDDIYKITFVPDSNWYSVTMTLFVNDTEIASETRLPTSTQTSSLASAERGLQVLYAENDNCTQTSSLASAERGLQVLYAENDNCIDLKLLQPQFSGSDKWHDEFIFVKCNNLENIYAYKYAGTNSYTSSPAIDTSFYDLNSQPYKTLTRFNYVGGESGVDIDVSTSKIILSGTQKVDEIIGMKDCSTVTANNVYPCNDGKQYYALNANTLMEV